MRHELFLDPEVHAARKSLPGHVRQRLKRAMDALAEEPRPSESRPLDVTGLDVPAGTELRRLRMDPWRAVYAVNDAEGWVWILAVRRRPPYGYEDIDRLVEKLR
jgi:mRNA interferase RelE/StbE